jgi:protein-S-isoprenylcysteine O-methyltransferase Ste14
VIGKAERRAPGVFSTSRPWGVVVAFAVLLDRTFIVREEQQLAETFGARFQQYRIEVRRWL